MFSVQLDEIFMVLTSSQRSKAEPSSNWLGDCHSQVLFRRRKGVSLHFMLRLEDSCTEEAGLLSSSNHTYHSQWSYALKHQYIFRYRNLLIC